MKKLKLLRLFFRHPRECAFEILAERFRTEINKRRRQHREYKSLERQLKMLRQIVSF